MTFIIFQLFFQIHGCPKSFVEQQPSHSCLCTFREKVLLVSHSSSHFCNHLVTSVEQRNFASAHLSKSLLQKFTTRLGERQRLTVLNCKSNPFIHAHEVSHSNWGTWNVALHMVLRDFQHSSITWSNCYLIHTTICKEPVFLWRHHPPASPLIQTSLQSGLLSSLLHDARQRKVSTEVLNEPGCWRYFPCLGVSFISTFKTQRSIGPSFIMVCPSPPCNKLESFSSLA